MPGPENNMVADFFEFLFFGIETVISSFEEIEEIEEIRYFGPEIVRPKHSYP